MKRDSFASDYDRIRRQAGMSRLDLDDESPVDHERVERAHQEFKDRMAELRKADEARAAEVAQRTEAFTRDTAERMRLRQFAAAGVEPPDGFKCSLSMLLSLGWTIENVSGKNTLVRPYYRSARPKTKEEEST